MKTRRAKSPRGPRLAVFHPEFWDDLKHWVRSDRATALRISQEHRLVYLVRDDRIDFLQARYHY